MKPAALVGGQLAANCPDIIACKLWSMSYSHAGVQLEQQQQ